MSQNWYKIRDVVKAVLMIMSLIATLIAIGVFVGKAQDTAELATKNAEDIVELQKSFVGVARDAAHIKEGVEEIKSILSTK